MARIADHKLVPETPEDFREWEDDKRFKSIMDRKAELAKDRDAFWERVKAAVSQIDGTVGNDG